MRDSPERGAGERQDHPTPAALARFLRGEASRAERRAVVRHLLTGCRACVALGRPLWQLADRPPAGAGERAAPARSPRSRPVSRWAPR